MSYRSVTVLLALSLMLLCSLDTSAFNWREPNVLVQEKIKLQRGLKMGMMGKGKGKYTDDEVLDDDVDNNSTTIVPSATAAPSSYSMKSCKKSKKSKKEKSEKVKGKGKKKGKSKKDRDCISQSPSPSPANVTLAPVGGTTVAPMATTTTAPASTTTAAPAAAGTSAPMSNSINATSVPTIQPSVQSNSKMKSKKGGKGEGGKGKGMMSSRDEPSRTTQPPATPSALSIPSTPAATRSKSASLPSSVDHETTKNVSTTNTSTKATGPTKAAALPRTPLSSPAPSSASPTSVASSLEDVSSSASPTSSEFVEVVDATPFQLFYNFTLPVPNGHLTNEQINEVVDITFTYMNDFLADSFDGNDHIFYDSLIGSRIAHSIDYSTIQFMASAQFINSRNGMISITVPTTKDVDTILMMALSQPSVVSFVDMLRNLPAQNPYSQTKGVLYSPVSIQTTPGAEVLDQSSSDANKAKNAKATGFGITGAVLFICLVTGTVALYRNGYFSKKRPRRNKSTYKKARIDRKSYDHNGLSPTDTEHHDEDDEDEDNDENEGSDADSLSDCTSSVHSCPPRTSSDSSLVDRNNNRKNESDGNYRTRILEEDVEIKFIYPNDRRNETVSDTCYPAADSDPLFPVSPALSKQDRNSKKRQNV